MLNILKEKNNLPVYSVFDKEFSLYGRVLTGFDITDIMEAGERIPMPESGSRYEPSTPVFEALPIAKEFAEKIYLIHFRNTTGTPNHFRETFHDNGDLDMAKLKLDKLGGALGGLFGK